jgi:translation initiation factor 1
MSGSRNTKVVYSTGAGRLCPECAQPLALCKCQRSAPPRPVAAGDGIVRVGRETKGRSGKGVTVVQGLPLADEALQALAAQLKKRCGSGGTVRAGVIEIQGEHRDTVVAELMRLGYRTRRAGG